MFHLLFTGLYIVLFAFIILKAQYFKRFGIDVKWIAALFVVKVLVGFFYWFLINEEYHGGDSLSMFRQGSIQVYRTIFRNPVTYFKLVFLPCTSPPPAGLEHYSESIGAYGDESYYFLVRFHALVRLVSFGYSYIHVVFYNFLTLTGILYLIKFLKYFIYKKDILLLIVFGLVPGVAFWTSGMHKDGFGLAAMGVFLYSLLNILRDNHRVKNFISLILSLFILTVLRNFVAVTLIAPVIAFFWSFTNREKIWLKFILVHVIYFGLVYLAGYVFPEANAINYLVFVQHEFFSLAAAPSTIPLTPFHPNLLSVLSVLPEGFSHCVFRPYLWEIHSVLQFSSAIENILLIVLTFIVLTFFRDKNSSANSFFLFCIFYVIGLYSLVGLIVPNLGAIVRYKCTGELFWLLLLIYMVDVRKVLNLFSKI